MRKIIYVDNFLTTHGRTPTTGTALVTRFRDEGYKVLQTSSKQNKVLRMADMLATIVLNKQNSVVLIATYSTSAFQFAWLCSVVCKSLKVPYIPCLHGGNLPLRIQNSPKKALQVFAESFTNVAVSGYLQKSLKDNGWRSLVIPNSIKIDAYSFKARNECKPKLLWVRSFHSIYNPALAIRILSELIKKFPEATLTMVGPDKDGSLEQCKTLAQMLGVEKQVTFTGILSTQKWVKLATECDIFINTTNFDNLPVSVVEAMALGMIAISTDVGGVPYLIENGKNGVLVPPDNETFFTEAIINVIENNALAEKLSAGARLKAEEFDWRKVRLSWKSLFDSVG